MYDDTTIALAANAARYPFIIDFILFPKNSTSSQGVSGSIWIGLPGGATTGIGDISTDELRALTPFVGANASENSTTALDLKVTVTHATNNASLSARKLYSIIEKL